MHPSQWLRRNSEHYLLEAAQRHYARIYLGDASVPSTAMRALFWRRLFVPVYRRLPWSLRHRIIATMPGSHRRRWRGFDDAPRSPGI